MTTASQADTKAGDLVRMQEPATLARALGDLASPEQARRDAAWRLLKLDPVVGWERFLEDDDSRRRTRQRLGASFFSALDRLVGRMKNPALQEELLDRLTALHGIEPWVEKALHKRLGLPTVLRFRALGFARSNSAYPHQLSIYLTHLCNTTCSYCFSLADRTKEPGLITPENFTKVLDWMGGQPYKYLCLLGGEPTIHPDFPRFVQLSAERGFPVYFPTNNLYSERVLEVLSRPAVANIQVHAMDPDGYRPEQWALFLRNLQAISKRGLDVWLRYNIYDIAQAQKWHFLFDLCRDYGLRRVNFALTFPLLDNQNVAVDTSEFRQFARVVVRFVRECLDRELQPFITKSFPICYFDPEDQPLMMERCGFQNVCTVQRNEDTHNLIVRPDLSLDPCIALKWKRTHLLDFKDMREIGRHWKEELEALQRRPLFSQCPSCPIYPLNVCQGACLAYKQAPEAA